MVRSVQLKLDLERSNADPTEQLALPLQQYIIMVFLSSQEKQGAIVFMHVMRPLFGDTFCFVLFWPHSMC
jgi:hypothetical protein